MSDARRQRSTAPNRAAKTSSVPWPTSATQKQQRREARRGARGGLGARGGREGQDGREGGARGQAGARGQEEGGREGGREEEEGREGGREGKARGRGEGGREGWKGGERGARGGERGGSKRVALGGSKQGVARPCYLLVLNAGNFREWSIITINNHPSNPQQPIHSLRLAPVRLLECPTFLSLSRRAKAQAMLEISWA